MAQLSKKKNGSRQPTKPGCGFLYFCPQCPCEHIGGKQMKAIRVGPDAKTGKCREGHVTTLRPPAACSNGRNN